MEPQPRDSSTTTWIIVGAIVAAGLLVGCCALPMTVFVLLPSMRIPPQPPQAPMPPVQPVIRDVPPIAEPAARPFEVGPPVIEPVEPPPAAAETDGEAAEVESPPKPGAEPHP